MKSTLHLFLVLISLQVTAQTNFPLFTVETSEANACYAKCMLPAVLDTISENIIKTPQRSYYQVVAATYDTIIEQIEIRPQEIRYEIIPAVYDTIYEEITIKDGESVATANVDNTSEDCYEIFTEKIEIVPPTKKWTRQQKPDCDVDEKGNECFTWELTELPEEYLTKEVRINNCAAQAPQMTQIAPTKDTLIRIQLRSPEQVREVFILAEYQAVTRLVLRQNAVVNLIDEPASYDIVDKLIMVREAGDIGLHEVWCEDAVAEKMSSLQKALKKRGFYKGKTKGKWSAKTQDALLRFQQENGLPIGQFDLETMKKLGL